MSTFRAEIIGFDRVRLLSRKLRAGMRDMRPLLTGYIEPDFYEIEKQQWATQGARGGIRWRPLSPNYAAYKAKKHPGRGVLVVSGDLRDGLTRRGGKHQLRRLTPRSMELGTTSPVAGYHQGGTRRMAAREVIRITTQDERRWQGLTDRYFADLMKKAGA
jgi:phage gpG-like protein